MTFIDSNYLPDDRGYKLKPGFRRVGNRIYGSDYYKSNCNDYYRNKPRNEPINKSKIISGVIMDKEPLEINPLHTVSVTIDV